MAPQLDTPGFFRLLEIDEKIKKLDAESKTLKSDRATLKEILIVNLAEIGITGTIIGNKQVALDPKKKANVSNKAKVLEVLKALDMKGFIKEDISAKQIDAYVNDVTSEDGDGIPKEFGTSLKAFEFIDLKIKKAA